MDRSLARVANAKIYWKRGATQLIAEVLGIGSSTDKVLSIGARHRINHKIEAHILERVTIEDNNGSPNANPNLPSIGVDLQPHPKTNLKIAVNQFSMIDALVKFGIPGSVRGYYPKSDIELCLRYDLNSQRPDYGLRWTGAWN